MRIRLVALLACAAATAVAADQSPRAKPILEKGMTAAAIIQSVGKPAEIEVLSSSEGKAEKWIYRRKLGQTVHQTANTQTFIPAMTGVQGGGPVVGEAVVPEYRLKYVSAYQVTALLMINDQLHLGRQWTEREEKFAD